MKSYTEKKHAKRLLKILEKPNTCVLCPAAPYFELNYRRGQRIIKEGRCNVCHGFIGLPYLLEEAEYGFVYKPKCPCHALGHKEAIKRTWIALEEKGYLDG